MDTRYVFGLPIKPDIDIGHLLTTATLLAGFLWWLFTTVREWRRAARKEAESGSLRLLLWLLRERQGAPIPLLELRAAFNAPGLRSKRKAYCKKDFLFKTDDLFERAIYQLDWEGKIDFHGAQSIAFRVDKTPSDEARVVVQPRFTATPEDAVAALRVLTEALRDPDADSWKLRGTARTAFALAPDETAAILRTAMTADNRRSQLVAVDLIGELLPERRLTTG